MLFIPSQCLFGANGGVNFNSGNSLNIPNWENGLVNNDVSTQWHIRQPLE